MTTAAELYALQEVDLALDSVNGRLAEVEAQLGETEELVAARELVGERRAAVEALREPQREREWTVEEARAKAAEIDKKLYAGSVRIPKELEDLQADLSALQAQVRRREDELLIVMVQLDEAEGALKAAEGELSGIEGRWRAEQERLREEQRELLVRREELEEGRAKRAVGLDGGAMGLYQALRERRQGRAVAMVERGMCQGCRITLPISVLQRARAGAGLVQCVSCERLLLVN